MNTTTKYIYEQEIIDPYSFKEIGVSELSCTLFNKDKDSKELHSVYRIDKNGRLNHRLGINLGWTAYPPLSSDDNSKLPDQVKEEYKFSSRDRLIKIEKLHPITKQILSTTHFQYENNYLVLEKKNGSEKTYTRNKKGKIMSYEKKSDINGLSQFLMTTQFVRNKQGLVTKKIHSVHFPHLPNLTKNPDLELDPIIIEEELFYKNDLQLEKVISNSVIEGKKTKALILFNYLNSNSELIESIKTKDDDNSITKESFEYDTKGRILKITKEGSNGNNNATIYERS